MLSIKLEQSISNNSAGFFSITAELLLELRSNFINCIKFLDLNIIYYILIILSIASMTFDRELKADNRK